MAGRDQRNPTMFQAFSWYLPPDGQHWRRLAQWAPELAGRGFTSVWLPPAYKGAGGATDVGYSPYDLWDLGEFDQKGTVRTKYGTRQEYIAAIQALHDAGLQVLVDLVLNHRMGGDGLEQAEAVEVARDNRTYVFPAPPNEPPEKPDADEADQDEAPEAPEGAQPDAHDAPAEPADAPAAEAESADPAPPAEPAAPAEDPPSPARPIAAWSRFTFPGRAGALDPFTWDHTCFTGCDWDDLSQRSGIFRFANKQWAPDVDAENGNFDYLMGLDVDLSDDRVYKQLLKWGGWYLRITGADGLRLDALKHMSREFYRRYLYDLRRIASRDLFVVGEYWSGDLGTLRAYLGDDPAMSLFDVPLHFNLFYASQQGRDNVTFHWLLDNTLVATNPLRAVTFVENHDTQPSQALSSTVGHWFKPLAYALILLRTAGYPCVFFADLFGLPNDGIPAVAELPLLMELRRRSAHGTMRDAFDDPELVGWTCEGEAPDEGCAVVFSRAGGRSKRLEVGARHAGQTWRCVLGEDRTVQVADDGWADFPASGTMLAVYVPEETADRLTNIPIIVQPQLEGLG